MQGSKSFRPRRFLRPHERLDGERAAVGQRHVGRGGDRVVERAEANVQAGLVEDLHQARDVHEVERVARVLLGNEEQVLRFRADLLDRRHRRLHRQRQHLGRQVVEAARKQVGVDRRQLEAGVPQVDRRVERRRVLHPLEPEPPLDRRQRLEHALLELVDRAGERGDEMGDHGVLACRADATTPRGAGILGIWGAGTAPQAATARIGRGQEKGPPAGGPVRSSRRPLSCGTPSRRARRCRGPRARLPR